MTAGAEGPQLLRRDRIHVRLSTTTRIDLTRRAAAMGLAPSSAARQFIEVGLARQAAGEVADADGGLVGLATLIAAEHAVLMVASVLPEGEHRTRSLAERAAQAADERLGRLRGAAEAAGG